MSTDSAPSSSSPKKAANQYDDPNEDYLHYWDGRDYEHESEEMAVRKLLNGRRFKHAVDVGGGFGRLCVLLEKYADQVTLTDPSQKQLDVAEGYLKDHPRIDRKLMQADDITFDDASLDLVTMVRVMHHLPDPTRELAEIARVLVPGGTAVVEVANVTHAANRVRYLVRREKLPTQPVDIRSAAKQREDSIPFVNHNPKTVIGQFTRAGLKVERTLSVSNLRSARLKRVVPMGAMLAVEGALQSPLASVYFGPSIFFLLRRQPA